MTNKYLLLFVLLSVHPIVFASSGSNTSFERFLPSYSQELSIHAQGELANFIGDGTYYVRAAYIPVEATIFNAPRVFYVYRSVGDLRKRNPEKKIFWKFQGGKDEFFAGSDLDLLYACLSLRGKLSSESTLLAQLEAVIPAVLYEGRARLLKSEYALLSESKLSVIRYVNPTQIEELRGYCKNPSLESGPHPKQCTWNAYYITQLGGLVLVRVIIDRDYLKVVKLEQKIVRPDGYFPEEHTSGSGAETWVVRH